MPLRAQFESLRTAQMGSKNRDDFTEKTKLQIAKRAGWLCSDPSCRRHTIGANSDGDGEINLGTAAHICAAAPHGPRYDPNQTPEQRRSAENGIWMCRLHGTAVDARDSTYTVDLLREWKTNAQRESLRRVLYNDLPRAPLSALPADGELRARIRAAATSDLDVFRRSDKWPSTTVELTLEVPGLSEAVSTTALAAALTTFDDLILVAPPGMGKTTTVFQIADSVLATGNGIPIVIPLGDWSTNSFSFLEFVLKRAAFRGISEDELRSVAARSGVMLLLDGWNELDSAARKRAAAHVSRLQAELPELSLLISTRKQALDVPIQGTQIKLLPLNETQQLGIGRALRGDAGERMVDRALRTAGMRDLVANPLYLTAVLALPEEAPFPTTKEEVLRRFVAAHEENTRAAEALAEVTHGLHQRFLEGLATTATRGMNTTIAETVARKSVSKTDDALVAEGQITEKPQPSSVLEVLVSHHVLVRVGDPAGYSFQHQQFLEWYASHFVERLILGIGDAAVCTQLKTDVLNQPIWEEAILFACERLARGDQSKQEACASAVLASFDVDPMLAAEMIYRSNDAVWARVASSIQGLVRRWHVPGKVDRAMRFMISSGRPEFLDEVWPLITHANDQVHLKALRAGRQFRPSILGADAARRIAAVSPEIRKHVLSEIAFNGSVDGLDLAAAIAKDDAEPDVKAAVVEALAFRGADRHITEVLRAADDTTFDLVARKGLVDKATDEQVTRRIDAACERHRKKGLSTYDRLRAMLRAQGDERADRELIAVIAEMDIDKQRDAEVHLLYEARSRHSRAIADGILHRVRTGRTLFYGADDLLAAAGLSLEDDALLEIALADTPSRDNRAEAAASVLGPHAVGRLIEATLDAKTRIRDARGKYDQAAGDRYHRLLDRLAHTPGASLVTAIRTRSAQAANQEMADLAELISRHPDGDHDRGRPFEADSLTASRPCSAKSVGMNERILAPCLSANACRTNSSIVVRCGCLRS